MKRILFICSALLFTLWLTGGAQVSAQMPHENAPKINLTEKQKAEMDVLYREWFAKHKQIVDKYVEFGVFPKEMADKKKAWLDERYKRLQENGFVPGQCPYKHKMPKQPMGQ